jgi:hypothetical protein
MKLTKQNHKACLNVIKLLHKIIDNNLPYNQKQYYQNETDNDDELITDWSDLIESKKTCCLMGYLVADDKFKKAGGTISENKTKLTFNSHDSTNGFKSYVGFQCYSILLGNFTHTPKQALDWFVDEYAKQLKGE